MCVCGKYEGVAELPFVDCPNEYIHQGEMVFYGRDISQKDDVRTREQRVQLFP